MKNNKVKCCCWWGVEGIMCCDMFWNNEDETAASRGGTRTRRKKRQYMISCRGTHDRRLAHAFQVVVKRSNEKEKNFKDFFRK